MDSLNAVLVVLFIFAVLIYLLWRGLGALDDFGTVRRYRQLPQATRDDEYTPTNENDIGFLLSAQDATILGTITLPSGEVVPRPRNGYCWRVRGTKLVEEKA